MNWIKNVVRPKIRGLFERQSAAPENLWIKCPKTGEMVFHRDLEANQFVVPGSNYHMPIAASERLRLFFDDGHFEEIETPQVRHDPLKFRDERRYSERLADSRKKTGLDDSIIAAHGRLQGHAVSVAIHEFKFMGGSLGIAAGGAIVAAARHALAGKTPLVVFTASGGARMQEGILSLMQMPRTIIAIRALREAGLPYIVVFTHPTTGGVTASYAMLGDVHIAEPGALIGFAGPRVIRQTIGEQLPADFQSAEYLLEHGMIDMVVDRHHIPATIARLCALLMNRSPPAASGRARQEERAQASGSARRQALPGRQADPPGAPDTTHMPEAGDRPQEGRAQKTKGAENEGASPPHTGSTAAEGGKDAGSHSGMRAGQSAAISSPHKAESKGNAGSDTIHEGKV